MITGWIAVLMDQIKSPDKWMWFGIVLVVLSFMFSFTEREHKNNLNYHYVDSGEMSIIIWFFRIVGTIILIHHFFFK